MNKSPFRFAAAQSKRIGPERLNWPGRLEMALSILNFKFLGQFSPSFLSQKWERKNVLQGVLCLHGFLKQLSKQKTV
jgi:hypothetical protein